MRKLKLGFFASHGGSNFQAIVDAINSGKLSAEACVLISNNSASGAMQKAEREGIPHFHISSKTHPDPGERQEAMLDLMISYGVEIIVLAGYMKKIGNKILDKFRGRILNIHPALLPDFGGKGMYGINVHKAVIEAGRKFSGPTVHVIDSEYDRGKILAQRKVPVLPDDTPETLAERVLIEEHKIYPETLDRIASGNIVLD